MCLYKKNSFAINSAVHLEDQKPAKGRQKNSLMKTNSKAKRTVLLRTGFKGQLKSY